MRTPAARSDAARYRLSRVKTRVALTPAGSCARPCFRAAGSALAGDPDLLAQPGGGDGRRLGRQPWTPTPPAGWNLLQGAPAWRGAPGGRGPPAGLGGPAVRWNSPGLRAGTRPRCWNSVCWRSGLVPAPTVGRRDGMEPIDCRTVREDPVLAGGSPRFGRTWSSGGLEPTTYPWLALSPPQCRCCGLAPSVGLPPFFWSHAPCPAGASLPGLVSLRFLWVFRPVLRAAPGLVPGPGPLGGRRILGACFSRIAVRVGGRGWCLVSLQSCAFRNVHSTTEEASTYGGPAAFRMLGGWVFVAICMCRDCCILWFPGCTHHGRGA